MTESTNIAPQTISEAVTMDKIISLCKRRGFVFASSAIYGGMANSYSYGPYGSELKRNIKDLWWRKFISNKQNIYGIDGPILLHPKLWEASGHTSGFNDAMVDCKACNKRFRADHLVEELCGVDLEGQLEEMTKALRDSKAKCPHCGKSNWSDAKNFNMMFKTEMNGIDGDIYLRPETAGAIFIEFNNILDSMHPKLPFGIGQIGKAFRNEIIAGNFIFRLREFEQMEIEYFIKPTDDWETMFEQWLVEQEEFVMSLGAQADHLRRREHPKEKLSHYSKKTVDIEYLFPFGWRELYGLANRTDFDLKQHSKFSNEKLEYLDIESNEKITPWVLEPTFGLDRSILVSLVAAYTEEKLENNETRVVMKFPYTIAPIKVAIFPLLKNRPELTTVAKEVFQQLKNKYICEYDDNGNIGKRYRRQDEIGTPFCITVDFDTLNDQTVTVRNRDTMLQERIKISELDSYLGQKIFN